MHFIDYDPAKREEWDNFVLKNPEAGFGHLSSQFLLGEENIDVTNRSIMVYRELTHLVAILPLYENKSRTMRAFTVRTLSSAAGPLFGADLTASDRKTVLDALIEHVKTLANDLSVDRISVTYPSIIDGQLAIDRFRFLPLRKYGFVETNAIGTYIDLEQTETNLLAALEKNCRYKLRKAEKEGVRISQIGAREEWLGCASLNEQTLGPLKHSKRTMELVWDEFVAKGHAFAFVSKHEDRTVGVEVIQTLHNCAYAWIAYNARPLFPGANNYLLWQCILHAKKLGKSAFLMGTYDFSEDAKTQGIAEFKKGFGGTPYYILGGTFFRKQAKHHLLQLVSGVAAHLSSTLKSGRRGFKQNKLGPPKLQ